MLIGAEREGLGDDLFLDSDEAGKRDIMWQRLIKHTQKMGVECIWLIKIRLDIKAKILIPVQTYY